ncbi:MAG: glycoside hydrolase family 3 N-terminal domain-containing protein [Elusimicrobiales bacterium]|jgi:beta-N-acetylhexosaminidase
MFSHLLIAGILSLSDAGLRARAEPSLEEKAGQLLMISIDAAEAAKASEPVAQGLGGIQLQWGSYSLEDTRRLTEGLQRKALQSVSRIPLFIATDYEGGSVYAPTTLGLTELPTNMMLGAAQDENNTASLFYLAGRELKRAGINMAFGPVLDVNTNPKNPIIGVRAIGGTPELVSKIGAAVINGWRAAGILAAAKHFPGHGAAEQDSHKLLPVIGLACAPLETLHLPPFKKAIELGVPLIMTAHILYPALDPGKPATLSKPVITDLLKKKLGFEGLVITDSLDMLAISSRYTVPKAAARAVEAGADLVLLGKSDFMKARNEIVRQVKAGMIPESRVDDAYYRIRKAKRAAGLFETQSYPSPFDKAYVSIAETLSREAVTLVGDKDRLIPLKDKALKTAIIIFAPPRFNPNALALYKAIIAKGYCAEQSVFEINPDARTAAEIAAIGAKADRLVIGSFQWAQAQNANQRRAIKALLALGKPSILISLMSPYDLAGYPEAGTQLAVYGMTAPGMAAAGEVLTGETDPRGRLPVKLE